MDEPNISPPVNIEFVDRYVYSNGKRVVGKMTGPDTAEVTSLVSCALQREAIDRMIRAAARRFRPPQSHRASDL